MNRNRMTLAQRQSGMALLIVLVLLSLGMILGLTFVTQASTSRATTANYSGMARARYLAESGAQHAMYLLRGDADALNGTDVNPLGPFTVDSLAGYYTISAKATGNPGEYAITST